MTLRRTHRMHQVPLFDSPTPWRAAILSVDSGKRGGWAMWLQGKLAGFGELDGFDLPAIQQVVASFLQLAEIAGLPVVLVMEKPATYQARGKRSFGSILGTGATRGVWRAAWLSAGCGERRIASVTPAVWRSRAMGKGWGGGVARDIVKAAELRFATAMAREQLGEAKSVTVGLESAPAILIGSYACRAAAVAKKLPRSALEAA